MTVFIVVYSFTLFTLLSNLRFLATICHLFTLHRLFPRAELYINAICADKSEFRLSSGSGCLNCLDISLPHTRCQYIALRDLESEWDLDNFSLHISILSHLFIIMLRPLSWRTLHLYWMWRPGRKIGLMLYTTTLLYTDISYLGLLWPGCDALQCSTTLLGIQKVGHGEMLERWFSYSLLIIEHLEIYRVTEFEQDEWGSESLRLLPIIRRPG